MDIVILTGAGISRESGIPTFRDRDGEWARVNVEDVASPQGFARDPVRVHRFYNERRRRLLSGGIHPNAAHTALAELERKWPGKVTIVTQNVDDLHERGGSIRVLHMHGELLKARCASCSRSVSCKTDLSTESVCLSCGIAGAVRPDVVWFGEDVRLSRLSSDLLDSCGLFLSIGTSGTVYPAAAFVQEATAAGAGSVELNMEKTEVSVFFERGMYGPATQVVPQFVAELLSSLKLR